MAIQDGALRTEAEKGTNVGTYDGAVRTEAEKDAVASVPFAGINPSFSQPILSVTEVVGY